MDYTAVDSVEFAKQDGCFCIADKDLPLKPNKDMLTFTNPLG